MMKKLTVLIMVLGLATVVNAGLLQISVGGDQEPVDSEIWLNPSDDLSLDIWTLGAINPFESHDWALVVDTTYGGISGGVATILPGGSFNQVGGLAPDVPNGVLPDPSLAGIWGNMANLEFTPIPDGTILVDQITFHCEGPGDAIIQLYEIASGVPFPSQGGVLVDQVVIHQTPEPATMVLLGAGSLLLRRKKRA